MKRILGSAAVLALVLGVGVVKAQDAKPMELKGVIADNKCAMAAGKYKDEATAAKHPVACAIKCANDGEKIVLISGDKAYKLDDKGNTLAKEYLEKNKANAAATKVIIMGTVKGDEVAVTSVKAQEEKKS